MSRRRSVCGRIDHAFKPFVEEIYPDADNLPERTRRLMRDIDDLMFGVTKDGSLKIKRKQKR